MEHSKELKKFGKNFLLIFTEELIRQQGEPDFYKLKKILAQEEESSSENKEKEGEKGEWEGYQKSEDIEKKKKQVKEIIKKRKKESSPEAIKERLSHKRPIQKKSFGRKPLLKVPQPKLPKQFQHLKPQAKNREIELEKLDPLINDPNVQKIECKGPQEKVFVKGRMGYQPTSIQLSENEVYQILKTFSDKSQIPLMTGDYHVAVGDLTLTASVDEDQGKSSFVIEKLSQGGPSSLPQSGPTAPSKKPKTDSKDSPKNQDKDEDDFSGYKKSS